jgi:predicted alpha-1,2-mannosidase
MKTKQVSFGFFLMLALTITTSFGQKNLTQFVNPFIGTGGHGHTFPGAVSPFGMLQLSPDTRMAGWDACSGYHYSDSTIIGFSHTHLSGTGIGDYGDILLMPTVNCESIDRGDEKIIRSGYRSKFSHKSEKAYPGYYSVKLDDYNVKAELTATQRVGFHRYTFPKTEKAAIVLDLNHSLQNHRNSVIKLKMISSTEIEGMKNTDGWAKDHSVYFYAKFSKPFKAKVFKNEIVVTENEISGTNIKALLQFSTVDNEKVMVKLGISAVDAQGARKNVEQEIAAWDFDAVVKETNTHWNTELSKVSIETKNENQKKIFYTSLYHAAISPNLFVDVDGRYRGQDKEIHVSKEKEYYTVFSLWDTFRAFHPLQTIIAPERNEAFIRTLLKKYDEGGYLPMWDLSSNYTGCMIGNHAISVIVEAYLKGNRNFDVEKAFEACVKSSHYQRSNNGNIDAKIYENQFMPISKLYKDSIGYCPADKDNESVAKGLEYAYNDWCIAQFAKALGKEKEFKEYSQKSKYYKTYFDKNVGFMRGKMLNGTWNPIFNPKMSNHRNDDYCEGNAWQWSWYVMQDVDGLIALQGGKKGFINKLDSLFSVSSEQLGQASSDISGLIGQYAHGNEPSHHITHLYNYVGQPWKTQQLVDSIQQTLYFNDPNGLAGNEDCGQMSAWYVLNAIGFYPVCPASGEYTFGRPLFNKVTIPLASGKKIEVVSTNNTAKNRYIQKVKLNGKQLNSPIIKHKDLMAGAKIEIEMGSTPNLNWGVK